ncbi:MAG: PilZ domain-containing protein [Pseudomonas sp.]|jgi:hypothetical protein|nr:PilZ domain-containing protein [Pseudomonas sp.]
MDYYNEKRDFIRMRIETAVTFEYAGKTFDAVCIDLSSTGMQIETDASLSLSQGQSIRVLIPSSHTELTGLQADTHIQRIEKIDNGRLSIGLAIISMQ